MSKLLLEAVGPWLVPHCVANWLVGGAVPPQFIATIPCDPADAQDSGKPNTALYNPLVALWDNRSGVSHIHAWHQQDWDSLHREH